MIGYGPNSMMEYSFRKQDRFSSSIRNPSAARSRKISESSNTTCDNDEDLKDKEPEFSQSVDVSTTGRRERSNTEESIGSSFIQSVVVVPPSTADGKYSIYTGIHDNVGRSEIVYDPSRSLLLSRDFGHNISNPEIWKKRLNGDSEWNMRKQSLMGNGKRLTPMLENGSISNSKEKLNLKGKKPLMSNCNCGKYHSHTFKGLAPRTTKLCREVSMEGSMRKKLPEVKAGNANQLTICNVFWKASMTFCDFKYGDKHVVFRSLWPPESVIKGILQDDIEDTGLRKALWELCLLSIISGPLAILKCILDLKYIRLDYQFDNDPGLLHLACLLQNTEAIQALTQMGVSSKIKDRSGKTAGEVCYCSRIRKQLPTKYTSILVDRTKGQTMLKPGLQDKDSIFRLASNPKCLYELQKKLQTFDFNVNTESNEDGDYLLHIACKAGLCQLPLIMSLERLQHANVEMCNASGLTPLMLVAQNGDCNLCDIMLCVFGASPSKQNERDGKTALHYAVICNHIDVVNCLIKRGADVNIEDNNLCRPDDVSQSEHVADDCREVIQLNRLQRCQRLTEMVTEDTVYPIDLRPSDLAVVDTNGYTLIMQAAMKDKIHNLETLLQISTVTMNAQHGKMGLTALGMAAKAGHYNSCKVLLRFGLSDSRSGSSASIPDIQGNLPIHHAVLNNHEEVVDVFAGFFPATYVGLYKSLRLCRKSSIHDSLTKAWERRQEEIINPQLRMCAMEGNAEKLFCILEDGDNVNSKSDLNNQPALFVAMENSHLDVIRLLIERGADLRRRDTQTGNTVLHVVSKTGHLETAKYLVEFCKPPTNKQSRPRLDINAVNNDRKTALQIAAEKGYIRLISLLIEVGATTALLNPQGELFTSPEFEGARVQIEAHRNEHSKHVMNLVTSKNRKSLLSLMKTWLPRFDHNLRDKNGDTPLMVACKQGRLEVVKFLLQSAVYVNQISDDDSDTNSDADSGVPDLPPWRSHAGSVVHNPEDMTKSYERSAEYGMDNLPLGASSDMTRTLNPSDFLNSLPCPLPANSTESGRLSSYLRDMERPKGLYIYHDGVVSHVCAVNLFDGDTPLHRAIEGGDNLEIATLLLEADSAVINMQNDGGLTPIHLACKLGRKKILQQLLTLQGIDLSLRTLNGQLPDEMTSNKSLIKMVQKARRGQPARSHQVPETVYEGEAPLTKSMRSLSSLGGGSTINFEKINDLYQSMRQSIAPKHDPGKFSSSDRYWSKTDDN